VINLGFSGNGRMEPEVIKFVAELDPAVFVLDCIPNMGARDVQERTVPGVKLLREAHPETSILVEDRNIETGFPGTGATPTTPITRRSARLTPRCNRIRYRNSTT
jgi:hypothetical protein